MNLHPPKVYKNQNFNFLLMIFMSMAAIVDITSAWTFPKGSLTESTLYLFGEVEILFYIRACIMAYYDLDTPPLFGDVNTGEGDANTEEVEKPVHMTNYNYGPFGRG